VFVSMEVEHLEHLQECPELFDAYHAGFRAQVSTWSSNPVDLALAWISGKPKVKTVADFGCGDAQLAQKLAASHTVHSFDLVARNKWVTACTMSQVPCPSGAL
jgi:Hypothetical methyltransferase